MQNRFKEEMQDAKNNLDIIKKHIDKLPFEKQLEIVRIIEKEITKQEKEIKRKTSQSLFVHNHSAEPNHRENNTVETTFKPS